MSNRLMSDAELRRRQKLQSKIGRTTSTMGLSALGVTGAAAVASRSPKTLGAIKKIPGLKKATTKGMENVAIKSGIVSGGIGGVGGFNQASIYSAESRRRKAVVPKKPVTKSQETGMEMGYYGEEGHPVVLPEIIVPIEKAWQPVASNFDSERSRGKRAKTYEGAALVGAGAGGAYAGHHGMKTVHEARKLKPVQMAGVHDKVNAAGKAYRIAPTGSDIAHGIHGEESAIPIRALKGSKALRHGGKTLAGVAAVGAAAGAHKAIKRKREQGSWQSYAKSATSAFGVDHSEPNGQHRETEN